MEFLRFALRPLKQNSRADLQHWRQRFLAKKIEPIILPLAEQLIDRHRQAGDTPLTPTATNAFVTAPIAERLGISHLIATEPESKGGRQTGEVAGIPCFQEGKVERLTLWLQAHDQDLGAQFLQRLQQRNVVVGVAVETAAPQVLVMCLQPEVLAAPPCLPESKVCRQPLQYSVRLCFPVRWRSGG